jgi:membrane fusion protein (multidrug efflux system)
MLSTIFRKMCLLLAIAFSAFLGSNLPALAVAEGVEFEGRIEAVERSDIYSRAEGIVDVVLVRQGDYVEAGAPLLRLRNDLERLAVDAAHAELAKAEALLLQAHHKLERAAALSERGAGTEVSLFAARTELALAESAKALAETELKVAKLHLEDTVIRAPIAGYVEDPRVGPGSLVEFNSGDPALFQLVNLYRLRVVFELSYAQWVAEANRVNIAEGASTPSQFLVVSETGQTLLTAITLTGSAVWFDEQSHRIRVWADIENPGHKLRPGMRVRVAPLPALEDAAAQDHSWDNL